MSIKRRFELVDGSSNKFWEIETAGERTSIRFGRIGTAGTTKDKTFGSAAEATREATKLIAEKTKKGYLEVAASADGSAAHASDAPATPSRAAVEPGAGPSRSAAAKTKSAKTESKPSASAPAVQALLEAIHKKEKELARQLRPAAAEASLASLRALEVPEFLLALYGAHDGTEAELLGMFRLLSIEEILEQRENMNALLANTPSWRGDADGDATWNEKWVPFLADGDGQYYCVDPTGAFRNGKAGQVLFYDHEIGPRREFGSLDTFIELLTRLAKKGLLALVDGEDEQQAEYDKLYASAKNAGLPKMPPKELDALLAQVDDPNGTLSHADKIARVQPLVRSYAAEEALWWVLLRAADALVDVPLLIEAATALIDLQDEPRNQKPYIPYLVLGLHRAGQDDRALSALRKGLSLVSDGYSGRPTELVPENVSPEFRQRALRQVTDVLPDALEAWTMLASLGTPSERVATCQSFVAACDRKLREHQARYEEAGVAAPVERRYSGLRAKAVRMLEAAQSEAHARGAVGGNEPSPEKPAAIDAKATATTATTKPSLAASGAKGDATAATKPSGGKPLAKDASPADILASTDASRAARVKAAKALGKSVAPEALVALVSQLTTTDAELSKVLGTETWRVFHARRHLGASLDLLPMFEEFMRSTQEVPIPADETPPFDSIANGAIAFVRLLQLDKRDEVRAALRTLAWTSLRGKASTVARSHLAGTGDPESVERVSTMLFDPAMRRDAVGALVRLPRDVGPRRAKEQLDTADPKSAGEAAQELFSLLEIYPADKFDAAASWEVLGGPLLRHDPAMRARADAWRAKHGIA